MDDIVDAEALRREVREKYREAALDPSGRFGSYAGRPLAAKLGYPAAIVDALPDRAVESFAGVDLRTFCIAGGLSVPAWQQMLEESGFTNVVIGPPIDNFGGTAVEEQARASRCTGTRFSRSRQADRGALDRAWREALLTGSARAVHPNGWSRHDDR